MVQPEFKLDALVWTCIFHEKVPRYSDKVYKMSAYLLEHFKYMRTLSFSEIESCMIDWSTNRVPFNSRERFIRLHANTPLSAEEYQEESESPYKTKKYHYNYRQPEELSNENLQRTFVNMCTNAFFHNKDKTVRMENLNLDAMNSTEREEVKFMLKRQLEELSELPDENDSFLSSMQNPNPLHTQFRIWKKNLFVPLTDQLEE